MHAWMNEWMNEWMNVTSQSVNSKEYLCVAAGHCSRFDHGPADWQVRRKLLLHQKCMRISTTGRM